MRIASLVASVVAVAATFWLVDAQAQSQWREFRSPQDGFSIEYPGTPKVTSRRIENSEAVQSDFLLDLGSVAYEVSVIQLPAGAGPKSPDEAYFTRLVNAYAQGSGSKVRSSKMITIAGHAGMEAMSDDGANLYHLTDITAVGDRIYVIVSAGPKGHQESDDAKRFRDSFKLITQ